MFSECFVACDLVGEVCKCVAECIVASNAVRSVLACECVVNVGVWWCNCMCE